MMRRIMRHDLKMFTTQMETALRSYTREGKRTINLKDLVLVSVLCELLNNEHAGVKSNRLLSYRIPSILCESLLPLHLLNRKPQVGLVESLPQRLAAT